MNLSRSPDGNYSLVINHFPANSQERSSEVQHRSMPGSQLQQQDTTAVLEVPPPKKKKQKSAAQRRRARKRFQRWVEKRNSRTESNQETVSEPVVSQHTADPMVLVTASCDNNDMDQDTVETITKTRPCNIQRFFTGVKMTFFQLKYFVYFQ